jgi:hypothetical protein
MRKSIRLALTLILLAGFVGCGAQPGKSTMTLSRGKNPPPPAEALADGVYAVYASNGTTPIYSLRLKEGDTYGFRKNADGTQVAFAKKRNEDERVIPLEARLATSYMWKFQAEKK